MSFRHVLADEAESVALQPNRLEYGLKVACAFQEMPDGEAETLESPAEVESPVLGLRGVPGAALDFTSLRELEEITVPGGWCLEPSPLELNQRLLRNEI
jgi:hypothetical protein